MDVKIIIFDGIVKTILADGDVNVEVVAIDKDYARQPMLRAYEK